MDYFNNYQSYVSYVKKLVCDGKRPKTHRIWELQYKRGIAPYYEFHHVIPKSLGGSNDIDNIIPLTKREHFLAHYLLCFIYKDGKDHKKMVRAFIREANSVNGVLYKNSTLYERIKSEYVEIIRNSKAALGHRLTDEQKKLCGNGRRGKSPGVKGLKIEEYYGKEKALEIRSKMRKKHKPITEAQRKHYGIHRRKKVCCVESGEVFESITAAEIKLNVCSGTLKRYVNKGKMFKGSLWKVVEDDDGTYSK